MNNNQDTKVIKKIDITPTWEDCMRIYLQLGHINQFAYDLFLPLAQAQDERNQENKKG